MSKIFGGSKSKSTSTNRGFESLQNTFNPLTNLAVSSNQKAYDFLLGRNLSDFEDYKKGTSFDFDLLRGVDATMANAASRGVVRSGARDKAIMDFGTKLQQKYAKDFVQSLLGIGSQGLQAGGLIGSTGGQSNSSSSSKPGIGGLVGAGLSGAASLGWAPLAKGD